MKKTPLNSASGFTTIQLLITIAIMSVVTGMAVVGISRARDHVRLMNSGRQFAAYVERARGDAVRRHGQSIVQAINGTTYSVSMDFDDVGAVTTRTFTLDSGVTFSSPPQTLTFNWRGRIPAEQVFTFTNGSNSV